MRKIVFFCIPAYGHTNPTLGVVRELVAQENKVWYYSFNQFQDTYEVMSKTLDAKVFKSIQTYIKAMRVDVTEDEARVLWPKVKEFAEKMMREPDLDSMDPYERRLAEVLLYARRRMMEKNG